MSVTFERQDRLNAPGYWAVEVRNSPHAPPGRRYLCHAASDAEAFRQARRLMGSGRDVHGFSYVRIAPELLDRADSAMPAMGASEEVTSAREWALLTSAHERSAGRPAVQ